MLSLGAWGVKITKRIVISPQIEHCINQNVFKFKHKFLWQHTIIWKSLENSPWVQKTLSIHCKARHHRCGWCRHHSTSRRGSKCFYQLLFKHLVCSSCLREKYFSKIVASFLFENLCWKRKWILLVSKTTGLLFSFWNLHPLPKEEVYCSQKEELLLIFPFFSLPHAWRSYSFLFLARKKGPHQEIRFLDNQMDDTPCSHLNLICSSHKNGIFTFIESDNCYHKQKTLLI